jgi:hypothetical protein
MAGTEGMADDFRGKRVPSNWRFHPSIVTEVGLIWQYRRGTRGGIVYNMDKGLEPGSGCVLAAGEGESACLNIDSLQKLISA